MRVLLAAATAILAVLAGCLGGDDGDGVTPTPTPPATGPYALDCSISKAAVGNVSWPEPCLALASPNDSPSKTEIDIVVNPTDPLNVVVASKDLDPLASPCVWAVAQVTLDGGHNWTTSYVGGPLADRQPGDVLYGYDCITDPIMAFNRDGDLYYNLQAYEQSAEPGPLPGAPMDPDVAMMALAISRDGGLTWPEVIPEFFGDDLTVFPDYMRMGTNPTTGSVFALWNTIVGLASSQPTLVTYRAAEPVTQPWFFVTPEQPTGLGESGIVGASDGTVYAFLGGFNSPGVAYMAISADDGRTFGIPARQFDFTPMGGLEDVQFRTGTAVELAVDTSGGERDGCLYAAWADGSADVADILLRASCDGGTTWTEPVLVSSGPHEDAQFFPRVAVDGRGGVHVVYLTRAYDPAHHLVDAEWAYSVDGGVNWTTIRLTAVSYEGDLGIHQNGFSFLGDYIGIAATGDHVWMGFPTTVTGRAEIAVAHAVATGDAGGDGTPTASATATVGPGGSA